MQVFLSKTQSKPSQCAERPGFSEVLMDSWELLTGINTKKVTDKNQNQRQTKQEDRSTTRALQDEIRKNKACLWLASNFNGKVCFNTYAKIQRKNWAFHEWKRP